MAVSLVKGQKISLEKEAGKKLTTVVMGLGWDTGVKKSFFGLFKSGKAIDLDASCCMFDSNGMMIDTVYFGQLKTKDGTIQHSGDNRTGAGEGDDEQIVVQLSKVKSSVTNLVFVVTSFTGENFGQVKNAYCRLLDSETGSIIATYSLGCQGAYTAIIMAKLYRRGDEWKMQALGGCRTLNSAKL